MMNSIYPHWRIQASFIKTLVLIISISLGVLRGTLLIFPNKFIPVTVDAGQLRTR